MVWEQWLGLFVASWIISLSPGAGAVASMSAGQAFGFRHGYWNVVGLQLALIAQIIIVAAGLGAVLAASEFAFQLIKWFGVGYLLYLGWKQWHCAGRTSQVRHDVPVRSGAGKLVLKGFLVNMSNPKAIVFFLAVLPQFLNLSNALLPQYVWITVTVVLVDSVVMLGYTGLASRVLKALRSPRQQKLLGRTFGGLFMGAAGFVAMIHREHN